jgi:hypothetical protein
METVTVSVALIREAYEAANDVMKEKMEKEFPQLLGCESAFIQTLPRHEDNLVNFCKAAFGDSQAIQITEAAGPKKYRGKALFIHGRYETEVIPEDGGQSVVILIKKRK